MVEEKKKKSRLFFPLMIVGTVVLLLILIIIGLIVYNEYQKSKPQITMVDRETEIPFEVTVIEDPENFKDRDEILVQAGLKGIIKTTYKQIFYPDEGSIEETPIATEVIQEKQDKIVKKGVLDYNEEVNRIQVVSTKVMQALKENRLDEVFLFLNEKEQNLYTLEGLEEIVDESEFMIEDYKFTGSVNFSKEKVEDEKENPRLMAFKPMRIIFSSKVTGRQEIPFDLELIHENESEWRVNYPGPTNYIEIGREEKFDDGGKTIGYPLNFNLEISNGLTFHNLGYVYFDYYLENTTRESQELIEIIEAKRSEYEKQIAGTETPAEQQISFPSTDVLVKSAELSDNYSTPYELRENTIFDKAWKSVPLGEKVHGRLQFSPVPSSEVKSVFLDITCLIWDKEVSLVIGEVDL